MSVFRTGSARKPGVTIVLFIAVAAIFLLFRSLSSDVGSYTVIDAEELAIGGSFMEEQEGELLYYQDVVRGYQALEARPVKEASSISIPAVSYIAASPDAELAQIAQTSSDPPVLHWNNDSGWVEWEFEVGETGLYTLELDYEPLPGSFSSVVRGFKIDGQQPFREAGAIILDRYWKDGQFPYTRNALGNEMRPVQKELEGLRTIAAASFRTSSEPLQWYLEQGRHTIRMTEGREPVALGELRLTAPKVVPSYEEYRVLHGGATLTRQQEDWSRIYEAEQAAAKSKPGIQSVSLREPNVTPDPKGRIVYNAIGGDRWKEAGDWLEWDIEVPEDGHYELAIQYLQTWRGEVSAYRTISIDGEVPFREMYAYELPSNRRLSPLTVQDKDGMPFLFYLTKGNHVLRMTADAAPVEPAALALRQTLKEMSELDRKLRTLTGNFGFGRDTPNTDQNRTWDIVKYYPPIHEDLKKMIERLEKTAAYLNGLYQTETDTASAIRVAVDTLKYYDNHVEDIPNRLTELTVAQNSLATWLNQLDGQMVLLDRIEVRLPGQETMLPEAGALEFVWYSAVDFARTFFMSYSDKSTNKEEAITVWVHRGRDYVDVLNQMIQQYFTPETGITVNVNLMPNPNALILSNAAGDQPDVVLGVSGEMPVDYAMRDAVADLSQFPGYEEVEERFQPGVMRSYQYNGGTYGLPEIQNFSALYYRTDVLDSLGLTPPDTWEDVYRMLPTLQEQGMAFYFPPKDFSVFFLQNKAPFYSSEGNTSMLGEKAALDAFTEWTELFDKYLFPMDVPSLIEHFRKGSVPIGIADFSFYVMLNVAAPDIAGNWKMLPIPGMSGEGGETERWAQQSTAGAMIMKQSEKQEEAWAFLDWWTSANIQLRYGEDVESLYGLEYRWNSANVEAILNMPWPQEELSVLREQFRWANNIPIVPGHYFLPRVMDFAWNDRILRGIPAKEALEDGDNSLKREIRRKLDDFGLPIDIDLQVPDDPDPVVREGRDSR